MERPTCPSVQSRDAALSTLELAIGRAEGGRVQIPVALAIVLASLVKGDAQPRRPIRHAAAPINRPEDGLPDDLLEGTEPDGLNAGRLPSPREDGYRERTAEVDALLDPALAELERELASLDKGPDRP